MIKQNGRSIIRLGTGDIKITAAIIDGCGVIAMNEHYPRPIGSSENTKETVDSVVNHSQVYISFSNIKSLEAFILKAQQARAMMLGVYEDEAHENITTIYQPNSFIDGKQQGVK